MLRLLLLITVAQAIDLQTQRGKMIQENVMPMDAVDLDKDGVVAYLEFSKWQKARGDIRDEAKIRHLFTQYDANHDDRLHVQEFVPLAYALSQKPLNAAEQIFNQVDLNGDGVLSRDEADISRGGVADSVIDSVFGVADSNRDGKITLAEFRSVVEGAEQPKSQEQRNREMAYQLMSYIDQNFDNQLNIQEVHAFANQHSRVSEREVLDAFRFLDSNQNGYLDVEELEKLPTKMSELLGVRTTVPVVRH